MDTQTLEVTPLNVADQILRTLQDDCENNLIPFMMLRAAYKMNSSDIGSNVILTPGGTADEFSTFALIFQGNLFFHSAHPNIEKVITPLFKDCKHINWNSVKSVGPLIEAISSAFQVLCKELNIKITKTGNFTHYFSEPESGKALTYKCPSEIYMAPLKEKHAGLINSLWPYRSEKSSEMIRLTIKFFGGTGVFLKETDEVISWFIQSPYGFLGFLHTIEEQRKKGYGLLVVSAMTKNVNEKGDYATVFIEDGNTKSKNLFTKLKYRTGKKINWFDIYC